MMVTLYGRKKERPYQKSVCATPNQDYIKFDGIKHKSMPITGAQVDYLKKSLLAIKVIAA